MMAVDIRFQQCSLEEAYQAFVVLLVLDALTDLVLQTIVVDLKNA